MNHHLGKNLSIAFRQLHHQEVFDDFPFFPSFYAYCAVNSVHKLATQTTAVGEVHDHSPSEPVTSAYIRRLDFGLRSPKLHVQSPLVRAFSQSSGLKLQNP